MENWLQGTTERVKWDGPARILNWPIPIQEFGRYVFEAMYIFQNMPRKIVPI